MLSGEHRIVSDGVHATLELSHTHRGEYCFTPKKWLELLDRNG